MSKKATRRAAREAFPKAKTPPAARNRSGARPRGAAASRNRAGGVRQGAKAPSIRRSVIWATIMAAFYFVLIQYLWKSSNPTKTSTNAIVAVISFFVFAGIVYVVDRFKYQRYLRKQKGSSK